MKLSDKISLNKSFIIGFAMFLCFLPGFAESPVKNPVKAPFTKGVNLSQWFERESPDSVQFNLFTRETFYELKDMGIDIVRLPIHFENLSGEENNWTINEKIFSYLDQVVSWAEEVQTYIILDNHSFDPAVSTPDDIEKRLENIWRQVAARYKDRSRYVMYEILNEPHGISISRWGKIQGNIIKVIRSIDKTHTIIAGGAVWNDIESLFKLPEYKDDNIVYTFHFYDPYLFTHQGGAWTDIGNIRGIPFPYRKGSMPATPRKKNQYAAQLLANYKRDGNATAMEKALDRAAEFSAKRNAVVFCGEMGVYMTFADKNERVEWYRTTAALLNERNIPWTMWDYYGSFGLFNSAAGGFYPDDVNKPLAKAIGFSVPDHTGPAIQFAEENNIGFQWHTPDSELSWKAEGNRFLIHNSSPTPFRGIRNGIKLEDGWNGGYVAADEDDGESGTALGWGKCGRYGRLGLSFIKPVDLSYPVAEGASLEFKIKRSGSTGRIQIRFENPETETSIPWRIGTDFNEADCPDDGKFHTIRIPLSGMTETGAWISSASEWKEGEPGKFNWRETASLFFTAEYDSMEQGAFLIKDIVIR